jgi:ABC-2 type transport system ATP-binding protein
VAAKLRSVPGVAEVKTLNQSDGRTRFQVESELKQDVRRELARTIVQNGYGLLELHASKMSLEDIFLKLTTAETETPDNTSTTPES